LKVVYLAMLFRFDSIKTDNFFFICMNKIIGKEGKHSWPAVGFQLWIHSKSVLSFDQRLPLSCGGQNMLCISQVMNIYSLTGPVFIVELSVAVNRADISVLSRIYPAFSKLAVCRDNEQQTLTFKCRVKSHLPSVGIIRSSPYFPR